MPDINEARTIERMPIDSSNLKSVGYDEARQILAVEFNSGSIFHYYNVPLSTFEEMGQSTSRGQFYAKQIRGKFTGKPMTGKCPRCGTQGLIGERCMATILTEQSLPVDRQSDVIDGPQCDGVVREIDRTHKD